MTEDKQFLVVTFLKTSDHSSNAERNKIVSVNSGFGNGANDTYWIIWDKKKMMKMRIFTTRPTKCWNLKDVYTALDTLVQSYMQMKRIELLLIKPKKHIDSGEICPQLFFDLCVK